MEPDFLLKAIHTRLWRSNVEELAKVVVDENFSVRELIDLTFHPRQQIGFKAAWNLDNLYLHHQSLFLKEGIHFLNVFPKQQNPSAKRHFMRIFSFMTAKKTSQMAKEIVSGYDMEEIIETIFAWLIDEKTAVAVKVFCLSGLANLSEKYPWIKDELLETIDFLVDKESVAFFSRAKEVRKQLALRK